MNFSIRTKILILCIFLVLVTTIGISMTYYTIMKQDKQRESRQRIQIAFDIILNDFAERINTYTVSVNRFLDENTTLLWATYKYNHDNSEQGTINFLFDHFAEVAQELKQFGRVAQADRVMLYGANKRLLAAYQRLGEQDSMGGFLVSEKEGERYLSMDDPSIQAEITFRKNNLALMTQSKPLPSVPLPPGVMAYYEGDIPDVIRVNPFHQGRQLGFQIIAPLYRRQQKMGLLVGEVFYTQEMVETFAALSKTQINLFSGHAFSVGTFSKQLSIHTANGQDIACQEMLENNIPIDVVTITFDWQNYYQGQCVFTSDGALVGAISVNLSKQIEQREVGKLAQAVFTISGVGIMICIGLVSWIVVPKLSTPLTTLTNAAFHMAHGDLEHIIDTSGHDEIGLLSRSFAYMRDEIQRKIEELQQLNAELDQRVERRTAQLARQQYILDTFMKTVPDPIYFKDLEGRITRANMAHARKMGHQNPADEIGKTDFDFFPEANARKKFEQEQHIIETGQPMLNREEFNLWPNGQKGWSLTTKMPLLNEHGQVIGTFGISRDITPLKQTEEALLVAKEGAEEAQKTAEIAQQAAEAANQAKTEFLANMNHELRTPLNVILGLAQIMARNHQIPADERENLAIMHHSGEHLLNLINTMLDLSKIEAGRMMMQEEHVDLFQLLDEVERMFSLKAAQKQLTLTCHRAAGVPQFVRTDTIKLRQVLVNLLNNAIKFTEHGDVTLQVRKLETGKGTLETAEESPESSFQDRVSRIEFQVIDTGPGVAQEEIQSLFEAFTQARAGRLIREGTGLGLTISQKFVQILGGDIAVESDYGHGAAFSFAIPVTLVSGADVAPTSFRRQVLGVEPGQPQYRILVVDNQSDNRQLLLKLLAPFGFEVCEAQNGREAIECWKSFEPHLIWMDMRMPVMDGYEATRVIKASAQGQATAIIALTASSFESRREPMLAAGCDDFLRKPFYEHEIFDLLRKHLGVQFVYAEETIANESAKDVAQTLGIVTSDALKALPSEIYTDLYQAVSVTDPGGMRQVIERIREQNAQLADALADLMKQFRFDVLQAVFEDL